MGIENFIFLGQVLQERVSTICLPQYKNKPVMVYAVKAKARGYTEIKLKLPKIN